MLGDDGEGAGVHQRKTTRAVGILRHARLEAGVAEESGLLISGAARHGDLDAEELLPRTAKQGRGRLNPRQNGRRYIQELEKLAIPAAVLNIEKKGATGVCGVGLVLARELVDEPGVHRAEEELPLLSPLTELGVLVEDPHELGAGEVWVEDEPRLLLHHIGKAEGLEFLANVRGTAALPDDGVIHGLTRLLLPEEGRLALVRDADGLDLVGLDLGRRDSPLGRRELGRPYLLRIVLDPAGLGKYLVER